MISIAAKEWIAEGRAEGRAEGVAEGEARSGARAGIRVLERRFGEVPAEIRERVAQAGVAQLEEWHDRGLDAESLEAVFAPSAH